MINVRVCIVTGENGKKMKEINNKIKFPIKNNIIGIFWVFDAIIKNELKIIIEITEPAKYVKCIAKLHNNESINNLFLLCFRNSKKKIIVPNNKILVKNAPRIFENSVMAVCVNNDNIKHKFFAFPLISK